MKRLRTRFLLLALLLLVPIGLLIARASMSLSFERVARHQAIAERLFDEMERTLSDLLRQEEGRPFADYRFYGSDESISPLAHPEAPGFLVGYFQVDPDGTLYTPLRPRDPDKARARGHWPPDPEIERRIATIEAALGKRWNVAPRQRAALSPFADRVMAPGANEQLAKKENAGRQALEKKVDVYSALQSLNRGARSRQMREARVEEESFDREEEAHPYAASSRDAVAPPAQDARADAEPRLEAALLERASEADLDDLEAPVRAPEARRTPEQAPQRKVRVELGLMTGELLDAQHMILYRTVLHDRLGYRQGLLIEVPKLTSWLESRTLDVGGLRDYATPVFSNPFATLGDGEARDELTFRHRFAEPFDSLGLTLELQPLPGLGGERYVYTLSGLLLLVGVLGLFALYRMVAVAFRFAERRSNFAAAVSHELKTPLTAIRMYAEMLRDGMVDSESKRHEYYEAMTLESERLSRLINNVLEFSRLEKGTREVSLQSGPVAGVLHEAAQLLGPHVATEGFELAVEIDPELPDARFDRDALVQILFNLVDNALKYARDAQDKRIELLCRREAGELRIAVRDHGPGVPPKHLSKVFEPFFRGEDELTRRAKGTGIGLALVDSLARETGGRVSAQNLESGFEVLLHLPAA